MATLKTRGSPSQYNLQMAQEWVDPDSIPTDEVVLHFDLSYTDPEPVFDGKLHIFPYTVPPGRSNEETRHSEVYWKGQRLLLQQGQMFSQDGGSESPENAFYKAVESDGGEALLYYTEMNVWVCMNFFNVTRDQDFDTENIKEIMQSGIQEALGELEGASSYEEYLESLQEREQMRLVERWREICMKRHLKRVKNFQEAIEETSGRIQEAREEMTGMLKELDGSKMALEKAKECIPEPKSFDSQLGLLFKDPRVKKVEALESGLRGFTNNIVLDGDEDVIDKRGENPGRLAKFAGKMIPLGEFQISINDTEGEEGSGRSNIVIRNLTNVKDGIGHPHVRDRACFGTIEYDLPKLLASYQYGAIITLVLEYLQSADISDSWGSSLTFWLPDAYDKEGGEEQEAVVAS